MVVGRFQVMATLQAARAYELGLPLESALSWGLNRAIFYAAAKRGFKGKSPMTGEFHAARERVEAEAPEVYYLGDDMAFKEERNGKTYFTIGGKLQTEEDFERQVEARFQGLFKEAWKEALKIVRTEDPATLRSGKGFYETVYRPRRDELAEKWTRSSQLEVSRAKAAR